jgi:hypothetical protein
MRILAKICGDIYRFDKNSTVESLELRCYVKD